MQMELCQPTATQIASCRVSEAKGQRTCETRPGGNTGASAHGYPSTPSAAPPSTLVLPQAKLQAKAWTAGSMTGRGIARQLYTKTTTWSIVVCMAILLQCHTRFCIIPHTMLTDSRPLETPGMFRVPGSWGAIVNHSHTYLNTCSKLG